MSTFASRFGNFPPQPSSPATSGPAVVVNGTSAAVRQIANVASGVLDVDYALGQQVEVNLNQNVTTLNLSNFPANGGFIELVLVQDATGGRTVVWPSGWLAAGGFKPILSTDAGAIDRVIITSAASAVMIDFAGLNYQ